MALDFQGVDLHPAHVDEELESAGEVQLPGVIDSAQIAGKEIAVQQGVFAVVSVFQVVGKHRRRADRDVADFAAGQGQRGVGRLRIEN